MPDTSYEFLSDFFEHFLPFTPTAKQVDTFRADLSLVSPSLMKASLIEVRKGAQGKKVQYGCTEWRPAIFQVYNRKVAEHARLYPVFHSFETAFRSTVAVGLETHYDHKRWWRKIYEELRKGHPANTVRQIGAVPVTSHAAQAIGQIINAIDGESFQRGLVGNFNNGFEFVERCDLNDIYKLIDTHWHLFRPKLKSKGRLLSNTDFKAKFHNVREARNNVYHHKSVSEMRKVVEDAEELLDCLNFSLSFVCRKMSEARVPHLKFLISEDNVRHHTW